DLAKRGSRWWALLDGRTLAESKKGSWRELGRVGRFRVTCLGVAGKELLVGTAEAHLLRLGANGLERAKAFDRVEGRDEWYTPWGGAPDTRSVAGGVDGALYVNVHVGGIPRSRDGGLSWQPTIDVEVDVHQVLTDPRQDGRVFVSPDEGSTWHEAASGLPEIRCLAAA